MSRSQKRRIYYCEEDECTRLAPFTSGGLKQHKAAKHSCENEDAMEDQICQHSNIVQHQQNVHDSNQNILYNQLIIDQDMDVDHNSDATTTLHHQDENDVTFEDYWSDENHDDNSTHDGTRTMNILTENMASNVERENYINNMFFNNNRDAVSTVPIGIAPKAIPPRPNERDVQDAYSTMGKLNNIEYRMAEFALNSELSNANYKEFFEIAKEISKETLSKGELLKFNNIGTVKALSKVIYDDERKNLCQPFEEIAIDVDNIPDILDHHKEEFKEKAGKIKLYYRDIKDLAEHLFSHRAFWDTMILQAEKQFRNGERIYRDIHTGTWFENMQLNSPRGSVVLGIMLASDMTLVCSNGRHTLWPLYMKLSNVPMELREKKEAHASRPLAYMPIIKYPGKTPPTWWATAKQAVFHHCMEIILKPFAALENGCILKGPYNRLFHCIPALASYSADLPEQRLLTNIRSGNSPNSYPRCFEKTVDFGNPKEDDYEYQLRTPELMKREYETARAIIENDGEAAALAYAKEKSVNIVKNAFWDVKNFNDPYSKILCDDVHQLNGVYQYILRCIEDIIKQKRKVDEVNRRAAALPKFRNLKCFKTVYLINNLKNPTFTEMKSHMSILLAIIHDLVPLQVSLCVRHFIDFFNQATAKEHTDQTLLWMNESLDWFNYYSPALQKLTNRKLNFPKNHMLRKYISDIRSHGIICGYSTNHSERQHRTDAKKPSRKTNFHVGMISQVVKYVERRDLFWDQYSKPPANINCKPINNERITFFSPLKRRYIYVSELNTIDSTLVDVQQIVSDYISNIFESDNNINATQQQKIRAYRSLYLNTYDEDGDVTTDILRSHTNFHGVERNDFAILNDRTVVQFRLFFTTMCNDREISACVVRPYVAVVEEHNSGLEVFIRQEANNENYNDNGNYKNENNLLVIEASSIDFPIHFVPDFQSKVGNSRRYNDFTIYQRFLINHDVSRYNWFKGRGILPMLTEARRIKWGEILSTNNEEIEEESEHDDDSSSSDESINSDINDDDSDSNSYEYNEGEED
ncbi:hypothetical protein BDA99DRAFT_522492 [Phascolomyces articulosus]|uniref:C2H2-type domain-containing protein n=1 Tax=Phascolomyces articulosus TaxID=60185 RepID=A0AAD5JV87_9FUNG|nr:hypothetical protein BDA99DRAFT_530298 [Phascolomyces articulosus]KAI9251037.1 hypothetical protein BDA99DRAFT_522492 [Phascolomyces articulosus]